MKVGTSSTAELLTTSVFANDLPGNLESEPGGKLQMNYVPSFYTGQMKPIIQINSLFRASVDNWL